MARKWSAGFTPATKRRTSGSVTRQARDQGGSGPGFGQCEDGDGERLLPDLVVDDLDAVDRDRRALGPGHDVEAAEPSGAGLQRLAAGSSVGDLVDLDLVEMRKAGLPVVRVTRGERAYAGFVVFQNVTTGTGARLPVDSTILIGWAHIEVVIGHQEWEVGIPAVELDYYTVFAVSLDRDDTREDTLGR